MNNHHPERKLSMAKDTIIAAVIILSAVLMTGVSALPLIQQIAYAHHCYPHEDAAPWKPPCPEGYHPPSYPNTSFGNDNLKVLPQLPEELPLTLNSTPQLPGEVPLVLNPTPTPTATPTTPPPLPEELPLTLNPTLTFHTPFTSSSPPTNPEPGINAGEFVTPEDTESTGTESTDTKDNSGGDSANDSGGDKFVIGGLSGIQDEDNEQDQLEVEEIERE